MVIETTNVNKLSALVSILSPPVLFSTHCSSAFIPIIPFQLLISKSLSFYILPRSMIMRWVIISWDPSATAFITADIFSPLKNTFFSWLPQHHTFLSFAFLFQLTNSFFSFAFLDPHPPRLMCPRAWCSHLYLYSHCWMNQVLWP